jgi:hypothetical protein
MSVPCTHTKQQLAQIAASIERFDWFVPIIVDGDSMPIIVDGDSMPIIVDGDSMIAAVEAAQSGNPRGLC